jgi:hypothetical protein
MHLDVSKLVLLGILAGTGHWLVARAGISRPVWSRATGWLDALLRCVGCSGVWLGLGLGALGLRPVETPWPAVDVATAAVLGAFTAPVGQAVLLWALAATTVVRDTDPTDPPSAL